MTATIGDEYEPVTGSFYGRRSPEALLLLEQAGVLAPARLLGIDIQELLAPLGQGRIANKRFGMRPVLAEYLNAVVTPVCDKHRSV